MLDAVYVDSKNKKRIVSIRPKPAFRPLFEVATMRKGSKVCLVTENISEKEKASSDVEDASNNTPCSWCRRGRVFWTQSGNRVRVRRRNHHLDAYVVTCYFDTIYEKPQYLLALIKG